MYTQMDFDPAEVVENELFGIDFVYDLSRVVPGEQLVAGTGAVITVTLSVISGVDATPAAHLVGVPYAAINPFNNTGLVTMVVQRISGLLPGVLYALEAVAPTTQGNTLSLWTKIPPENPPNVWQPTVVRP